MVPSFFIFLEAFPLTANGKVDRKSLPAPNGRQTEEEYVAPQSALEKIIVEGWREILKVEKVGVHDNFFEVGGHSLLLTGLHQRLEQLLQRKLLLVDLFQHPTIGQLAE